MNRVGYLYRVFGSWHVRYWVAYNDLPDDEKQKIKEKCDASNKAPAESCSEKQTSLRWWSDSEGRQRWFGLVSTELTAPVHRRHRRCPDSHRQAFLAIKPVDTLVVREHSLPHQHSVSRRYHTFCDGKQRTQYATQSVGFSVKFLVHPLPTDTDLHPKSIPDWKGNQPFEIQ